MRAVIQRVSNASVEVEKETVGSIGSGLLILLGIENDDSEEDIQWLVNKIINLRIFNDPHGIMNVSLKNSGGELLIISQFTLMALTKKGNRPSYIKAAKHDISIPLYERFLSVAASALGRAVEKGIFGADMKVNLLNDGPVTFFLDSKNKA